MILKVNKWRKKWNNISLGKISCKSKFYTCINSSFDAPYSSVAHWQKKDVTRGTITITRQ